MALYTKLSFVLLFFFLYICINANTIALDSGSPETANVITDINLLNFATLLGPLNKPMGELLLFNLNFTDKLLENCYNAVVGNHFKLANPFDSKLEFSKIVQIYYVSNY